MVSAIEVSGSTFLVSNSFNTLASFRFEENLKWLHAAPMFHIADVTGVLTITQLAGEHYFIPGFTPDGVLKSIEGYKITDTILVPTMVNMLVYHPEVTKYDLSSLRQIGRWSSEMVLIFFYNRQNIWPVQDIGLLRAISNNYKKKYLPPKSFVNKLRKRFSPYCTLAVMALWYSVDNEPVQY